MLRQREKYVNAAGELTDAGWQALQGELDTLADDLATDQQTSRVLLQTQLDPSGLTSIEQTSIPAWVNRITVMGASLSTNGTNLVFLQVSDGASYPGGYTGTTSQVTGATAGSTAYTSAAFLTNSGVTAAMVFRFKATIERQQGNVWVISGGGSFSNTAATTQFCYQITLSGALDRLKVGTNFGVDTFDAGAISVSWE